MRTRKILLGIILIALYSNISFAGLQEDFDNASDLEPYRDKVKDIDTLEYIRNLTAIIQRENIQILNELREIKERLMELENKIGK